MSIGTTLISISAGLSSYGCANYEVKYQKKAPKAPAPPKPQKEKKKIVIKEESLHQGISTSLVTTATSIIDGMSRSKTIDGIYEKYSSAYIDSMSEEQLASALERLDLMEYNMDEGKENTLTLQKRV